MQGSNELSSDSADFVEPGFHFTMSVQLASFTLSVRLVEFIGSRFYVTMSIRLVEFNGSGFYVTTSVQLFAFTSPEFRFNGPADDVVVGP